MEEVFVLWLADYWSNFLTLSVSTVSSWESNCFIPPLGSAFFSGTLNLLASNRATTKRVESCHLLLSLSFEASA